MKKIIIPYKLKGRVLTITIGLSLISLALFSYFLIDIVRARAINIDNIQKRFAEQNKKPKTNFLPYSKLVFQQGSNDKGIDFRCLSWSSKPLYSGWTEDSDPDFFIEYYIPPGKKAIICATPALATALAALDDKNFLYEVYKYDVDEGLHIRIIIGMTEIKDACESLTGNIDCGNLILEQQAIVRYEP